MVQASTSVKTTLRIPGRWLHPGNLLERMPDGFQLTPQLLILPDGAEIEFNPLPPDDQFAEIFASSCRRPPTDEEIEIVNGYTLNVGLTGPGGSMQAATQMMQAGAAIVQAGGGGVFIDNSALAHGGEQWLSMTEQASPDALSFAFVGIILGRTEVYTMGMQVLGLPNVVMRRSDTDADSEAIIDVIRYLCTSEKSVGEGHLLANEGGALFQAEAASDDDFEADSPMHNPFGRLRLVSMKDIAERN